MSCEVFPLVRIGLFSSPQILDTEISLCKNPAAEAVSRSSRDANRASRAAAFITSRESEDQNQDITAEERSRWLENRVW
jgi:hypothetical protein